MAIEAKGGVDLSKLKDIPAGKINAIQPEPQTPGLAPEQDKTRIAILELGRAFVAVIRDLEAKQKSPMKTMVVMGAITYLKKLMTNNLSAVMDDFTSLLRYGRETNKQIHEPFSNDAINDFDLDNEE